MGEEKLKKVLLFNGELALISEEYIFGALSNKRALDDCIEALKKANVDMTKANEILASDKTDFKKMLDIMDNYTGV